MNNFVIFTFDIINILRFSNRDTFGLYAQNFRYVQTSPLFSVYN